MPLSHTRCAVQQPFRQLTRSDEIADDKRVCINRALGSNPSAAMFVFSVTMESCPCGCPDDSKYECTCSIGVIQRHRKRISGPLLDRIDISTEAPRVDCEKLLQMVPGESSVSISVGGGGARAPEPPLCRRRPGWPSDGWERIATLIAKGHRRPPDTWFCSRNRTEIHYWPVPQ